LEQSPVPRGRGEAEKIVSGLAVIFSTYLDGLRDAENRTKMASLSHTTGGAGTGGRGDNDRSCGRLSCGLTTQSCNDHHDPPATTTTAWGPHGAGGPGPGNSESRRRPSYRPAGHQCLLGKCRLLSCVKRLRGSAVRQSFFLALEAALTP
jgi:hypothetical protein